MLKKPYNSSYCVCLSILRGSVGAVFRLPLLVFLSPVLNLLFGTESDGTPAVVHMFLSKDAFSCLEFNPSALEYEASN